MILNVTCVTICPTFYILLPPPPDGTRFNHSTVIKSTRVPCNGSNCCKSVSWWLRKFQYVPINRSCSRFFQALVYRQSRTAPGNEPGGNSSLQCDRAKNKTPAR